MTTRLFLARHGETEANRRGLALGRADVPLNDNGRGQATRLAQALAAEPIVAVYSSPLVRTMETAGAIAAAHGLTTQIEPGLIEMDIGEVDGLTFAQVRERYPQFLDIWASAEGPDHAMPGGERLTGVQQRATEAIRSITQRHPDAVVCAVTHNFVILTLVADVLGIDLAGFRRLRHGLAAITTLEISENRRRLVRLNDTCHLRA